VVYVRTSKTRVSFADPEMKADRKTPRRRPARRAGAPIFMRTPQEKT
jgi:hypothetical protein